MSLAAERDRLAVRLAPEGGAAFAEAWREVLEPWLVDRFEVARRAADLGDVDDAGLALVAVGGLGRGDLAPGSDLDLLLLHDRGLNPATVAEALWYPIWDEGLSLGHAVRTERDALAFAAADLPTATALLSARPLAGDREMTARLAGAARARWSKDAAANLGRLREASRQRWAECGEVAFLLEPDLKQARGGLRDVQTLRWADLAAPLLDADVRAELAEDERIIFDIRVALHAVTGRPTDRFGLEDQDEVGELLGVDPDELVARLSAAARRIAWIADEVGDRMGARSRGNRPLLGWRSRSRAPGVIVRDGQVLLEPSTDPATRPELVFDVARVAVRTGARPARSTLTRIADRAPSPTEPWPTPLRDRFIELLGAGRAAIDVIESLDHAGLWQRYVPEWGHVRSRPQRNALHRFTVDRHLLEATANAAALADRVERPDLLVLGALLHDLAKGRPGDHSVTGAELADAVGARMGLDGADRRTLATLVRHHLLLPDVATRRDLDDPMTVSTVADAVGDRPTLHLLAALTEADAIATGPAAWSPWKADLVAGLVRRVDIHLAGGDATGSLAVDFPSPEHLALIAAGEVAVDLDGGRLSVVAPDRPGLLARVAGALGLLGLAVRAADAAVVDGFAVERFDVEPAFGSTIDEERLVAVVRSALADRLAIEARLAEREEVYRSHRPTRGRPSPIVRFDDGASAHATVVEVHAADRPGLLHRLARAFAELALDVSVVKAQTLDDLAVDAFYVTHRDGAPVTDPEIRAELERALRHAVS